MSKTKTDKFRNSVLSRDNERCRNCGCPDVAQLAIDHIKPECKGGETTLENLQALCGVCNNLKADCEIEFLIQMPINDQVSWKELNEHMAEYRLNLKRRIQQLKTDEFESALNEARQWRNNGVKMLTIVKRLEKRFGKKNGIIENIRKSL